MRATAGSSRASRPSFSRWGTLAPRTTRSPPSNASLSHPAPSTRASPRCPAMCRRTRSRTSRSSTPQGKHALEPDQICVTRKLAGHASSGTVVDMPPGEGLRERKKRETKAALSWAALHLSVERGYGNVLVEDIAPDAGVSPRTFNNYFGSKAEAIVWRHLDRAHAMSGLLRER